MVGERTFLANRGFEEIDLAPGEIRLNPQGTGWTFEGGAGIVDLRNARQEAFTKAEPGEPVKLKGKAAAGFQFTVGNRDIYVYDVGHVVQPGEKGSPKVNLYEADGRSIANRKVAGVDLREAKPGQTLYTPLEYSGWATSDSSRVGLWRLEANKSYVVLSDVSGTVPGPDTKLAAGPGITIDGPAIAGGGSLGDKGVTGGKIETTKQPGEGYPVATFRYAFAAEPKPGMAIAPSDPMLDPTWKDGGKGKSYIPPSHRTITRAAFLAGKGTISQDFEIDRDGEYALVFTANSSLNQMKGREGDNPIVIRFDGQVVWDKSPVGGGRKPKGGVFQWGTRYIPLKAGKHRLSIESTSDDPRDVVYLYATHVGDLSDFYGGPNADNFLGAGAATGQTEGRFALISQLCTAEAQLWGLVPYAYEGGTNAGGDWNGEKLLYPNQFKWTHPISKVADNNWAHFWHDYGGINAFYYYPGFDYKYLFRAETFMPWAAAVDRAHTWVWEPTGPPAAPVTFDAKDKHYQSSRASQWNGWSHPYQSDKSYARGLSKKLDEEGMWDGFVFRAPKAGQYTITAETTPGGRLDLLVDDGRAAGTADSGSAATVRMFLTQGVHAVKVKNAGGSFEVTKVSVE